MGGGLLSSDGSYVNVINSILWDNKAGLWRQWQSNRRGRHEFTRHDAGDLQRRSGRKRPVRRGRIMSMPCILSYVSTQPAVWAVILLRLGNAASQIVSKIAANFASYRLALVDFRDYPDGNHGALTDWAYRDRVTFTTDANALISGIQQWLPAAGQIILKRYIRR